MHGSPTNDTAPKWSPVDRDADDYIDRTRRIERSLKDRVRQALGLPTRTTKTEINLIDHAKINGIAPSYELPTPDAEHTNARHSDDDIQTLLLPNDFERKLNAISRNAGRGCRRPA